MQVAEVHEEDLFNATKRICNFLPSRIQNPCFRILSQLEPYLSNVSEKLTPDLFCMVYGTCTIDKNEDMCHLFPVALDKSEIDNFSKQVQSTIFKQFCFNFNRSRKTAESFQKLTFASFRS
jgi:hypothetical protein